jgi:hypothetical protein
MNIQEVGWGMDCNDLSQGRDWWLVPVKAVMTFGVP